MSSNPVRFMYHLMLTVQPSSAPDRKRPSKPWLAADSSSSMPKIWEAIHSPRCPAATGPPMTLAILASMLLRSCRRAAMCAMGSSTFGSISPGTARATACRRPAGLRCSCEMPVDGDKPVPVHIGKSFVLTWAALYEQRIGSTEPWLLDNVRPVAATRGHYEPDEFTAVARWKTPRSRPAIAANSGSDIRQLLDQAGHAIQPGPHRLASLDDLYSLVAAEGITVPPEIKTAC